jgi:hypothetical protein
MVTVAIDGKRYIAEKATIGVISTYTSGSTSASSCRVINLTGEKGEKTSILPGINETVVISGAHYDE